MLWSAALLIEPHGLNVASSVGPSFGSNSPTCFDACSCCRWNEVMVRPGTRPIDPIAPVAASVWVLTAAAALGASAEACDASAECAVLAGRRADCSCAGSHCSLCTKAATAAGSSCCCDFNSCRMLQRHQRDTARDQHYSRLNILKRLQDMQQTSHGLYVCSCACVIGAPMVGPEQCGQQQVLGRCPPGITFYC